MDTRRMISVMGCIAAGALLIPDTFGARLPLEQSKPRYSRLERAPLISPDRVPALRLKGVNPDQHGRLLNAYFVSATRISIGDGIPGLPHVREIRSVQLNLGTDSGEVLIPAQLFERNSQNRVNMLILTGSDLTTSSSVWINSDRSCPIGVGICGRREGMVSFGVVPVEKLLEEDRGGEVSLDAAEVLKRRARRP